MRISALLAVVGLVAILCAFFLPLYSGSRFDFAAPPEPTRAELVFWLGLAVVVLAGVRAAAIAWSRR